MELLEQYKANKAAYEARRIKQNERPTKKVWWFRELAPIDRFTGWLVAYTGLLFLATSLNVAVLVKTDGTLHDTLVANNRAWIAPIAGTFAAIQQRDQPISVRLSYQNVGKEPAIRSNHFQQLAKVKVGKNPDGTPIIGAWPNETCSRVAFASEGQTIYPTATPLYNSSIPPNKNVAMDDDIISTNVILVWQGCFKYETMNMQHRSAFCFWLRPDNRPERTDWVWNFCPTGNFAD